MQQENKRSLLEHAMDKLDTYPLTKEQKEILRMRYLANGNRRMGLEGVAEELHTPIGRVGNQTELAIEIIEQEENRKLNTPPPEMFKPATEEANAPIERQGFMPWTRFAGELFETLDIILAAAMMCDGYRLIGLKEPPEGKSKQRIIIEIGSG